MATTTFSVRLDEEVKKQFDDFCDKVGLSANAVFSMFATRVVMEKRIPFEIADITDATKHHRWILNRLKEREVMADDPNTRWLTQDEVMDKFRTKYQYGI